MSEEERAVAYLAERLTGGHTYGKEFLEEALKLPEIRDDELKEYLDLAIHHCDSCRQSIKDEGRYAEPEIRGDSYGNYVFFYPKKAARPEASAVWGRKGYQIQIYTVGGDPEELGAEMPYCDACGCSEFELLENHREPMREVGGRYYCSWKCDPTFPPKIEIVNSHLSEKMESAADRFGKPNPLAVIWLRVLRFANTYVREGHYREAVDEMTSLTLDLEEWLQKLTNTRSFLEWGLYYSTEEWKIMEELDRLESDLKFLRELLKDIWIWKIGNIQETFK